MFEASFNFEAVKRPSLEAIKSMAFPLYIHKEVLKKKKGQKGKSLVHIRERALCCRRGYIQVDIVASNEAMTVSDKEPEASALDNLFGVLLLASI